MVVHISDKTRRDIVRLSAYGIAAGFLNGLLGAGGGIVLIYALSALHPQADAEGVRDIFAAAILCVIAMSALSAALYTADHGIGTEVISDIILPAAAGGILGAFLLDKIRTDTLKKIFAGVVLFGGLRMILG